MESTENTEFFLSPAEINEIKEKEKSLKIDFIMKSQFVKFVLIRCLMNNSL